MWIIARGDESLILWWGIEYLEICLEHKFSTPFFQYLCKLKSQERGILLRFQVWVWNMVDMAYLKSWIQYQWILGVGTTHRYAMSSLMDTAYWLSEQYGYIKNHKKTVKNGQTRTRERKSVQEPEAKVKKVKSQIELVDHGKLLKLTQFLMGPDDIYQPITSNILTREILSEVKDAFVIVSKEESHRGIPPSTVKTDKPQLMLWAYLRGGYGLIVANANELSLDPKVDLENSRFTPHRRIGFRRRFVQGANADLRARVVLTSLERNVVLECLQELQGGVGSNGNLLWEASVLLGRKKGGCVMDTLKFMAMPFGLTMYHRFIGVNEPGSAWLRKEEKMYMKFSNNVEAEQRGKLSRCGRNQMGNEPILALPEGADDFVVYYDARSKDLEACLEKGEGDCLYVATTDRFYEDCMATW
ncbi:hypothetical protein Tco_0000690 [Tanacetum coccineum]